MKEKNILVVGKTGESIGSLVDLLKNNDDRWRIINYSIDNLTEKEIARDIIEICDNIKGELTQVLLVFSGGRITKWEVKAYNVIKDKISAKYDIDITKWITIVRTNFLNFKDRSECEEDIKNLEKSSDKNVSKLIRSITQHGEKFIHIYIPLLDNWEDSREKYFYEEIRDCSREILFQHFNSFGENYTLQENLSNLLKADVEKGGGGELSNYFNISRYPDIDPIFPEDGAYLKNSIKKYKQYKVKLPTHFLNEEGEIVNSDRKEGNYAILSHSNRGEKDLLKSLEKFGKAYTHLQNLIIKGFWIDKYCIDQKDSVEIKQEMQKMSGYYGNSIVTLIAIHENLGDPKSLEPKQIIQKIVNSRWFSRAWTYQEGLLSQRTLLMFDDYFVDGTWLAQYWEAEYFTCKKTQVTPIGWSYNKKGYHPNDKYRKISSVISSLDKALEIVTKEREVTKTEDIIYCVLGLFPFGEKVDFKYDSSEDLKGTLTEVMSHAGGHVKNKNKCLKIISDYEQLKNQIELPQ